MSSISQPIVVARGPMGLVRDYSELMKARVTTLIVMTAWCGFYFGAARSGVSSLSWTLLHALAGIALVSGGTAGMNEVMERDLDALMRRTAATSAGDAVDERAARGAGIDGDDRRRHGLPGPRV